MYIEAPGVRDWCVLNKPLYVTPKRSIEYFPHPSSDVTIGAETSLSSEDTAVLQRHDSPVRHDGRAAESGSGGDGLGEPHGMQFDVCTAPLDCHFWVRPCVTQWHPVSPCVTLYHRMSSQSCVPRISVVKTCSYRKQSYYICCA